MNRVLEQLRELSLGTRQTAVLIRHGERISIPRGSFGLDVLLTPQGMYSAEEFGRALANYPVRRIYTSPIKRCIQTAECLAHGLSRDVVISCENNLGNPGFHISDAAIAGKYFLRYGTVGVFERFAAGEKIPGVASMQHLQNVALHWLGEKCGGNGVFILVTHDSLIAHFAKATNLREYTAESWVGFLDGVIVEFN